ncbi:MAG: hypothetical protein HDR52_06925 [Treponema sp.]|nr:hypothetical protein [Treponema sp.]
MTEREKKFYQNLIIANEDNEHVVYSLKSKGVEKHILIKKQLLAWNEDDKIEYSKIASAYRYDKRIRYVLFKYISYLEEFYRAVILDNYINRLEQDFWTEPLQINLKKYNNNLNDALEHLEFSSLLTQCQRLPEETKNRCFPSNGNHLKKNLFALKELRNAVMHNKFLLLYRGFNVCYVEGVDAGKSANLKASILNLIQFLPEAVGLQCAKDINACKDDRDKESDTKWDLPPQIVISINA